MRFSFFVLFFTLIGASHLLGQGSFIVIDGTTGHILASNQPERRARVASLTKVATAVVALDWLRVSNRSASEMVVIPPEAFEGGVNPVGLQPGDQLQLRDALASALVQSDNVAATAVAIHVGRDLLARGGPGRNPYDAFVFQMNQLAGKVGMRRTRFTNPHGLDLPGQNPQSNAADMARLARYAIGTQGFVFYVSQKERRIEIRRAGGSQSYVLRNTNQLLGELGVNGMKTGRTRQAGDCLILSAERPPEVRQAGAESQVTPRRIILVLLGSTNREAEGRQILSRAWGAYDAWAAAGRPSRENQRLE
ncbi:MAG: D-alanyl-D-alanine carboxypeptidase family protein [Verrucomicrobiales bacterium]